MYPANCASYAIRNWLSSKEIGNLLAGFTSVNCLPSDQTDILT